jgi:large subunit ribosomal protein L15
MSITAALPSIVSKSNKRIGRGYGSGKSKTAGRGTKGQGARKSGSVPLWFEGGQLPLIKRLPMWRGKGLFNVLEPVAEVKLADLEKMKAAVITLDALKLEKVIDTRFKKAKVIAGGTLSRAITLQGVPATKSATEAIAQAGGKVEAAE